MGNTLGVIVGRFQTPYLHKGHLGLINHALKNEEVTIFLGVRDTPATDVNPLSFHARAEMIRSEFRGMSGLTILPLADVRTNEEWVKNLDRQVSLLASGRKVTLYGGRGSFLECYAANGGKYPTEFYKGRPNYSATKVRAEVLANPKSTIQFREGVVYALGSMQPRVYETVDIAVFRRPSNGYKAQVLLGKKRGETKLRLPGGFVDFRENGALETFEQAARRELLEETGLTVEGKLTPLGDYVINDWRIKDTSRVGHRTALFAAESGMGQVKAADDLEELFWIDYDALSRYLTVEHQAFIPALQDYCKTTFRNY